jgi:hypothetical protein
MDANAIKYSPESRAKAITMFHELRNRVVLDETNSERGSRYGNDDHVMWILESQSKEDQFLTDPAFTVCQALHEAARSDYWYHWEKDYGTDDCDDVDDDEDYEVEE